MIGVVGCFDERGVMTANGKDAGGTGADDGLGAVKHRKKMAHQTAGGGPIASVIGKLPTAGLGSRVGPGDAQVIQELAEGPGYLWSVLIDITGDKELNRHK